MWARDTRRFATRGSGWVARHAEIRDWRWVRGSREPSSQRVPALTSGCVGVMSGCRSAHVSVHWPVNEPPARTEVHEGVLAATTPASAAASVTVAREGISVFKKQSSAPAQFLVREVSAGVIANLRAVSWAGKAVSGSPSTATAHAKAHPPLVGLVVTCKCSRVGGMRRGRGGVEPIVSRSAQPHCRSESASDGCQPASKRSGAATRSAHSNVGALPARGASCDAGWPCGGILCVARRGGGAKVRRMVCAAR